MWQVFKRGFDDRYNILYIDCNHEWRGIDIETDTVKEKIIKPVANPVNSGKYGSITNPYKIRNNEYIGFTNNITGTTPYLVVLFNEKGEVKKEYPNYHFYKKHDRLSL